MSPLNNLIGETNLSSLPRAERFAIYSEQLSNVRAALEWSFGPHGDDETATRLPPLLCSCFWNYHYIECQAWAERAMAPPWNFASKLFATQWKSLITTLALMHTEGNDQRVRTAFGAR